MAGPALAGAMVRPVPSAGMATVSRRAMASVRMASVITVGGTTHSGLIAGTAMAMRLRMASASVRDGVAVNVLSNGTAVPPGMGIQAGQAAHHMVLSPAKAHHSPGATGRGVAVFLTERHAGTADMVVPPASVPMIAGATVASIEAAMRAERA